jgi:uncharacterized Fe-S cluster-containing protein
MNQRDIELVNKVAEMTPDVYNTKYDNGMKCIEFTEDALQKFADIIRADEREFCAKTCEDLAAAYQREHETAREDGADSCAIAIRARGNT